MISQVIDDGPESRTRPARRSISFHPWQSRTCPCLTSVTSPRLNLIKYCKNTDRRYIFQSRALLVHKLLCSRCIGVHLANGASGSGDRPPSWGRQPVVWKWKERMLAVAAAAGAPPTRERDVYRTHAHIRIYIYTHTFSYTYVCIWPDRVYKLLPFIRNPSTTPWLILILNIIHDYLLATIRNNASSFCRNSPHSL